MEPQRIQRKRTKGWRMPENTVSVCRPGRWGNPFIIGPDLDAQQAIEAFESALLAGDLNITLNDVSRELRGKYLACWCQVGTPCHVDVLLRYANSESK